ncbi:serine/threonine-protein kinase Kist-like [Glandiceps talaboti]
MTDTTSDDLPNFKQNEVLHGEWHIVRKRGKGTCSAVFEARTSDEGARSAIKVFKNEEKYLPVYYQEIQILQKLNNRRDKRGIVALHSFFVHNNYPCLVFELLDCGLRDLIYKNNDKGLSLYSIQTICRDILQTLDYVHSKGIIHADIKPANLMWCPQEGCVKLIDFGLSIDLSKKKCYHQIQSLCYQSPEAKRWNTLVVNCTGMFDRSALTCMCTTAIDVWTVGCILPYLYTGQKLYSKDDVPQLGCTHCQAIDTTLKCKCELLLTSMFKLRDEDESIDNRDTIVQDLKKLSISMLQCKGVNRPSASEALQHPFFQHSFQPSYGDLLLFPTCILRLLNTVDQSELDNSSDYQDLCQDIKEECNKYGSVKKFVMPKQGKGAEKVYIQYEEAADCKKAQRSIMGKYFKSRTIITTFFPTKAFEKADYF